MWQKIEKLGSRAVKRGLAVTAASLAALAAASAVFAVWRGIAPPSGETHYGNPAVWTEVAWPFPVDQWGVGKAFKCEGAECGGEVNVYLRAKLGSCNCATGVANDDDLDRMSDFDLVAGAVLALASGQPVKIGNMNGRDRGYALTSANPQGKSALSIVFNDRCDMVVATAILPHDQPIRVEPAVIAFLNSPAILRWTESTLGL
jgi:hypothetical protein